MKKMIFVVFIFMVVWVYGHPQHHYRLQLEKKAVFGGDEPVLERIEGVCEDEEGNFYVLDVKAFKVYKVSPQGKLLLSFGHKGEGPGDFLGPHHIAMSEKGQIIVCEHLSLVSIFDRQKKGPVEKINRPIDFLLTKMHIKTYIGYRTNESCCPEGITTVLQPGLLLNGWAEKKIKKEATI